MKIADAVAPGSWGVFVDLGSGLGKAVLTAHLVGGFQKCIGIELLESLHSGSLVALDKLKSSQATPATTT